AGGAPSTAALRSGLITAPTPPGTEPGPGSGTGSGAGEEGQR
ncbi:NADH-quinone oxidoreductase subunit B, partial [Streptomyces cavourensis]